MSIAPGERIIATYRVAGDAATIAARAEAIALEQSVELAREAVTDATLAAEVVGRVDDITEVAPGAFDVRIALAAVTAPPEPGQLLNMLFGNTSLHPDVTLQDATFPASYGRALGGPRVGLAGLRASVGAAERALTASALKPQGLPSASLARLAGALAAGGIDIVKDDHGLADQRYSPFAERVPACARAVRDAASALGRTILYAPSLSGSLDAIRDQLRIVRSEGLRAALVAPMVVGLPAFHALAREAPDIALIAHPSMAGAARIAPPLLLGKLFRLLGADATIFPNYGGRFSYSRDTCEAIAREALGPWGGMAAAAPMPAGGMSLARVPEMLDVYGRSCILLIGGGLLSAGARITEEATAFSRSVAAFANG